MKILLMVDIQNDFLPTGMLPVSEGDQIISVTNKLVEKFDLVAATQDWHPENHKSFAINNGKEIGEMIKLNGIDQMMWPTHCVQDTNGAEFVPDLNTHKIDQIFQKGTDPEIDSYSGFFDNDHKSSTGLEAYLKSKDVNQVYIAGLALDYCVMYTALDCHQLGFDTYVIVDATRGVNIDPQDSVKAVKEMGQCGIKIIQSMDIV